MKRLAITIAVMTLAVVAMPQQRVVNEVKKNIGSLTMTADSYKAALTKIKPALTADETSSRAETWYVAGKVAFGLYDKYVDTRRVGKKVDSQAMASALLEGYGYMNYALTLDTVYQLDKLGNRKVDSKTGAPRFKTKYSGDIVSRFNSHLHDFKWAGSEFYNAKRWDDAFTAWDDFLFIADRFADRHKPVTDSIKGQVRYFQAITRWQQSEHVQAVELFAQARQLGYRTKDVYDYALICLSDLNDEQGIVALAAEAYERFGTADAQYIRILINDDINHHRFDRAALRLDEAIAAHSTDAELYNLKGLVVEQQQNIEAALPLFEKSVELNPDDARSRFNVGRYYYNKAMAVEDANPRLSLKALRKKVNPIYEQALPHLERAYQLDPTNDDVRNALRTIYYKQGNANRLNELERH